MKNNNKNSTRYYSDAHEYRVAKSLGGTRVSNSGAGVFSAGDVIVDYASMLIECKCSMSEKSSFSIKKEWLEKNKEEAFRNRLMNSCLCFNFAPNGENYYVIDEKLMKTLMAPTEFIYDSH